MEPQEGAGGRDGHGEAGWVSDVDGLGDSGGHTGDGGDVLLIGGAVRHLPVGYGRGSSTRNLASGKLFRSSQPTASSSSTIPESRKSRLSLVTKKCGPGSAVVLRW